VGSCRLNSMSANFAVPPAPRTGPTASTPRGREAGPRRRGSARAARVRRRPACRPGAR
jgi:hypothetical protein